MDEKTILNYLKAIPLFQGLREDDEADLVELHHLARIAHVIEYATGDKLFLQGDPANKLYIVTQGKVRLTRYDREGIPRFLRDVGPREFFGETGLIIGDFHDASAEALTTTEVLYFEQEEFQKLLQQRPRLRRRLKLSPDVAHRQKAPEFKWLRPDELLVYEVRRHWAYLARKLFIPFLLMVILAVLALALWNAGLPPFAALVLLLDVALFLYIVWETRNWRDDHFVLTTQRVVHYEEQWPINRHLEEAPLDNIQDVHLMRSGLSPAIFDYGDLILQTAGETVKIDLTGIPRPNVMREKIFQQIERNRAQAVLQSRLRITESLQKRINLEQVSAPAEAPAPASPEKPQHAAWAAIRDYFFPPSWALSADGESIIWRRYWLAGVFKYILLITVTLIALFEGLFVMLSGTASDWEIVIWLILMSGLGLFFLWKLEDWRNDYFEITPTRFIQIERKPFLLKESRRETTLDRIQNISYVVPNPLARIFRYGTVTLETAGTEGRFTLNFVRYPDKVQAEISKRQKDFRKRQAIAQAQQRQDELLSWFAAYDAMRKQQESTAFDAAMRGAFPESGEISGSGNS